MGMTSNVGRSSLAAAFAAQLRAERAASRLSRAELAARSGVSESALKRLEAGQREMDTDQLARLCRALGVSVVEFVTRADAERRDAESPNLRDAR